MSDSVTAAAFGMARFCGDINFISIGEGTNLQDGVIGHLADDFPLEVGKCVTIGHGAVIHACVIEDECLIGMNATVLDGARIDVANQSLRPERWSRKACKCPKVPWLPEYPQSFEGRFRPRDASGLRKWAEKYIEVAKAHQASGLASSGGGT